MVFWNWRDFTIKDLVLSVVIPCLVAWLTAWATVKTAPIAEPDFTVVLNGKTVSAKNFAGTAHDLKLYCMINPPGNHRVWPAIDVSNFHSGPAAASSVPAGTVWEGSLEQCHRAPGLAPGTDNAYVLLHYLDGKGKAFNEEHEYYVNGTQWYEQVPVSDSAHANYNALIDKLDMRH